MKHDTEMASGGMIHIPNFMKVVMESGRHMRHITNHTHQGNLISLVLKESRLKIQLTQIHYTEKVICLVKCEAPTED